MEELWLGIWPLSLTVKATTGTKPHHSLSGQLQETSLCSFGPISAFPQSEQLSKIYVLCVAPPLSGSPTHQHAPASGPLHSCSLAPDDLLSDVSVACPLSSSLSLLTCCLLNTTHPATPLKTATQPGTHHALSCPTLRFCGFVLFLPKHFSPSLIF